MELSNGVIQERQQFIKSMTEFVEEKQKKLNEVLERLGLSAEELLKSEEKKVCPYNKDHIIPAKSFNKHTESCKLLSAGYQKDELPSLLQDVDFCYKNLETGMKIELDEKLLNKIIWDSCVQNGQVYTGHRTMPVSQIDENIMLTQDDRLAVYNYVVKKSHEAGRVIPVDRTDELLTTDWGSLVKKGLLDEQNNKQYSSKLEQLVALRDLKRRRQSYRAKNVHITKKSYTEIIREVILNQMEILVPSGGTHVMSSADQEDTHKPQIKHENRGKDRRRDYSSCEREVRRRDYIEKNDDDKGRSEGRSRGVHSQRYTRQDRSHERYGDRKVRDRKRSRSRDRSHERAKIKEEDDSYSSNKGRPSASTEGINLLSSVNAGDGPVPDTTEESAGHVVAQGTESTAETTSYINLPEESEKQNLSDNDSSSSKKHGKHKKSKHKKKHRKKHKRRD